MNYLDYYKWRYNYYLNRSGQDRLGQAFCNDFVDFSLPELYYEEDDNVAEEMILTFLDELSEQ